MSYIHLLFSEVLENTPLLESQQSKFVMELLRFFQALESLFWGRDLSDPGGPDTYLGGDGN